MSNLADIWFTEKSDLWPGAKLSLQVKRVIYTGKSKYQDIIVLETTNHGKALVLDGAIQCTESDECSYQEMISFLPLFSHKSPKKVLIVGGGDGGVAREVVKHPLVENVDQVEIDELVVEVCKKYLPSMAIGFNNPKVKLYIEDGLEFIKNKKGEYDVIITDSSDPIGPAETLFQKKYFELLKLALKPNGIVCSQAGTPWSTPEIVVKTYENCKASFPVVRYGLTSVPTYPDGQIGFVIGSLDKSIDFKNPSKMLSEDELSEMELKYYTSEIHTAAFSHPRFLKNLLR